MLRLSLFLAALFLVAAAQETPIELPGIHNLKQASETVFIGSEPEGEAAFGGLKSLGITTIISVDGARPDVVTAKKYGLRYVHIPFGYDGIPERAARALARVARDINSPMYVHCHHGKHRGPAAAAIVCLSAKSLTRVEAIELMTKAGTGTQYAGLWRDVKNFSPPSAAEHLPQLVEVSEVDAIPAAMAMMDRSLGNLALCSEAGWKAPIDRPDLLPESEVLLVQEGLNETGRHLTSDHDEQFRGWLKDSEKLTDELFKAVKSGDPAAAAGILKAVERSCQQCHSVYRNP